MVKLGIAVAGAAGIGVTTYLGYSLIYQPSKKIKEETIGEKMSEFFLVKGTSEQWSYRHTKLSGTDDKSLIPELKDLKGKSEGLESWCSEASKKPHSKAGSLYLSNVRNYCTLYVKDKLGGKLIGSSESWDAANKRLIDTSSVESLSPAMKGIKSELETTSPPKSKNVDALKIWCTSNHEKPYLGESDSTFKDIKVYCVKLEADSRSILSQPSQ